jgi:hypothetical protein
MNKRAYEEVRQNLYELIVQAESAGRVDWKYVDELRAKLKAMPRLPIGCGFCGRDEHTEGVRCPKLI